MKTVSAKTIVTRTKNGSSGWFGAEYNMNIYRGCSHGCIYCDSRSDCYHNTDFGAVKAKENALEIIRNDLRRKVKRGVISTGAMSDPYNPEEAKHLLTRNALELLNAYEFGVAIATKSDLIIRDVDILKDIKSHSPVIAKLTVTTADDSLCKKIEPYVAPSSKRFEALERLSLNGIFCGVLMMPILPFINDDVDNLVTIVRRAKEAGAKFIYPALGMTLRSGNREYYYSRLDELFPGLKEKYIKTYGYRYQCSSKNARKLWTVFKKECEKLNMLYDMKAIIYHYKNAYERNQLSFF